MKQKSRVFSLILVLALLFALIYLLNNNESVAYDSDDNISIAMNTMINSVIYCDNGEFEEYITDIQNVVTDLENEISWTIDGSDIDILNNSLQVSNSDLAQVIAVCLEVSELTGGCFDISIGDLINLWDISSGSEIIPSEDEIILAAQNSGYEKISIIDDTIILSESVSIDLGSIGKGLALDEIEIYLEQTDVDGAIISVGGSVLAYGNYNDAGDTWQIAIQHPRDENSYIGVLKIDEGFVSTSGDYEQYFEVDGVRYHHILDANTGYPSCSDLISVTVVASSGLLSDALSTAIFACGSEYAQTLLDYYGASAILIDNELNINVIGDLDFEILD